MYRETLVVGATGMLFGFTELLARKSHAVSITARTSESLARLSNKIAPVVVPVCVQLDWNDRSEFLSGISKLYEDRAGPDIVVAWLHDDSLGPEIASEVAGGQDIAFYHVRGSATANPNKDTHLSVPLAQGLSYHEIVLGFQIQEARARWLNNDEICNGIIRAIEVQACKSIVGTVEPWGMRP